jgi:hypothetical protein
MPLVSGAFQLSDCKRVANLNTQAQFFILSPIQSLISWVAAHPYFPDDLVSGWGEVGEVQRTN